MSNSRVVVVGAGPVGLLTALGLAQAGVPVTVVERGESLSTAPRAMVYHTGVLSGLERLGVLDDVKRAGVVSGDIDFVVYKTGERMHMNVGVLEGEIPHPYNVNLGQDKLGAIAMEHLGRLPDTEVVFGTSVTGVTQDDRGVTLAAERNGSATEIRADWVIAADGAASGVRRALGIEFEGMTWPERFVATNIRYDFAAHGYATGNMVIDDRYGAIVAKIDDTGFWRCTFMEDASLPEETVAERIPAFFAETLPGDKDFELVQFSPYRMHQRAASTFRAGRVLLAGDAAHATNPTGGMGLTSGLFDSYVLSEGLAAVVNGEASDSILDTYSEQRRTAFLEHASPTATAMKQLVYHSGDLEALEPVLAGLRMAAADPEVQKQQMRMSEPVETPSLLAQPAAQA